MTAIARYPLYALISSGLLPVDFIVVGVSIFIGILFLLFFKMRPFIHQFNI